MSKKLILLIALVLVLGPFISQSANGSACNILADPNFELNEGWELWTWQRGEVAIESEPEIQLNGNYLRAYRTEPGGSGAAQDFDANEGDILCIQGWVRTSEGATGICAGLTVAWGDENYEPSQNNFLRRDESWVIGEPALTGEILDWTFVQMETPPAPAGTVTARIECFNNIDGEGDAYFDEISACWGACPNPKANTPNPFNGALGVSKTPTLTWSPGVDANSQDVYFGTDYTDVNDATTSSVQYKGNQASDVNSYSPGLLELGQTYYWRIDAVNEFDPNIWKGDVWSFTVASIIASHPTPSDGEQDVHRYHATLSWVWGADANSHDIYFGTSFSEVNDATTSSPEYKDNQPRTNTSYDPGFLELGQAYYWRIDEVNESGPNIWKGDIWSFTVGTSTNVLVNPGFEDGMTSDPWNEGLTPELWNKFTWGNAWAAWKSDSAQSTFLSHGGDKLFAVGGWVDAGDPWGSGAAIYQDTPVGVIEVNDIIVASAWARTEVWGTPISALKVEFKDVNGVIIRADESIIINGQQKLTYEKFTVVTDPAPAGTSYAEFLVLGGSPGTILVDDVSLDIGLPVIAWDPSPHHGATSVVQNADLSWRPGLYAASHDVYFGTSFAEVNDADTNSSEFKNNQAIDVNSYGPGPLVLDTRYYWRIDEVNEPNTWRGDVWSFTTLDRLIVDYFDSYADTDALLTVWHDYWTNGTGAELLLETDPQFTYNGNAMEFFYDNSEKTGNKYLGSETDADTANLMCGSDWTVAGLKGLVLRFYGGATNSITANDRMYIALEDTGSNIGVLEHPDMNEFLVQEWSEWNIDMEDFNDLSLDLANISKVYIGFGGPRVGQTLPGGPGTVRFDDIELLKPRCVSSLTNQKGDFTGDCVIDRFDLEIMAHDWLITDYNVLATAPSLAGLVARYEFEGNVSDSSGNGHDGIVYGAPTYPAGVSGLAIELDGVFDYVSIPGSNTPGGAFDINDTITVTAWIKVAAFDTDFATIISKGDSAWRLARNVDNDQLEFASTGVTAGSIYGHIAGTTSVDDGQWHHVAGVYDGSGLYLYIDGVLDAWDDATGFINNTSYEVCIGENAEATGRLWNGLLDDVRVYSRALPHSEIVSLAGLSDVYQPVVSVANISDSEAKLSKTVNFKDYTLMAENWLMYLLFPFE
jgi:hypothetical protein